MFLSIIRVTNIITVIITYIITSIIAGIMITAFGLNLYCSSSPGSVAR